MYLCLLGGCAPHVGRGRPPEGCCYQNNTHFKLLFCPALMLVLLVVHSRCLQAAYLSCLLHSTPHVMHPLHLSPHRPAEAHLHAVTKPNHTSKTRSGAPTLTSGLVAALHLMLSLAALRTHGAPVCRCGSSVCTVAAFISIR
jgi:hypothetical protein